MAQTLEISALQVFDKQARPDGLLRGLRPLALRVALRAINPAPAPGCRTADPLVRRPSLDRSQVDDLLNNSVCGSSNISARYVALSACSLWVVTSNIRRNR